MKIKDYKCKCGSENVFLEENGSQTGIYCSECGKWIKWVTKDEIRLIKHNYENRLKADMVAMLEDLKLEIEKNTVRWYVGRVDGKSDDVVLMETINDIIKQKINALKADGSEEE